MGTPSSKITIITVVRNRIEDLEETIESVFLQEYENLDYIIIDGASDDGTTDIIENYEPKLKTWLSEPDQGIYDAMNKGWKLADLDSYILYLGAGDRITSLPQKLPLEDAPDVVYGHVWLGENRIFKSAIGPQLRIFNSLHHQALLVKKSFHPDVPFDLQFPRYADFDFNQRLYKCEARYRFDPHLVSFARPGGVTQTLELDESLRVVCKNFGIFWSAMARFLYYSTRVLPILRRLRPMKPV